jgi:hypothetical protein
MTLTIIYRADVRMGPRHKPYDIVEHEDVPRNVAVQAAKEFESYDSDTGERYAFISYTTETGKQRLVIDNELAVAIRGTEEGEEGAPLWKAREVSEKTPLA